MADETMEMTDIYLFDIDGTLGLPAPRYHTREDCMAIKPNTLVENHLNELLKEKKHIAFTTFRYEFHYNWTVDWLEEKILPDLSDYDTDLVHGIFMAPITCEEREAIANGTNDDLKVGTGDGDDGDNRHQIQLNRIGIDYHTATDGGSGDANDEDGIIVPNTNYPLWGENRSLYNVANDPDFDFTAPNVKRLYVEELKRRGFNPKCAFEDDLEVCRMYHDLGIDVLVPTSHMRPGDRLENYGVMLHMQNPYVFTTVATYDQQVESQSKSKEQE